jgi:hypothetical protein
MEEKKRELREEGEGEREKTTRDGFFSMDSNDQHGSEIRGKILMLTFGFLLKFQKKSKIDH